MSAGEKLCTCGHHKHHHIQAVALDADGNEAIGSLVQCFGLGRENGCPCSHYVPAGYVAKFVTGEEADAAIRTLHTRASISGVRFVLLQHAGDAAVMHTNAPTPEAAFAFLASTVDTLAETDDAIASAHVVTPAKDRTDARRFVLLPDLISVAWQQFEEQIGGLDDDDDDDDEAPNAVP